MPPITSISVIGAGAMGAFYASRFYDMDPGSICLVAGGDRYRRLKEDGLAVNGKPYPIRVIRPEEKGPPSELVMVAVKHHHLDKAIRDIRNRVGEDTVILSVMNGIESEKRISAVYGAGKVLYAVAVGIDAVRADHQVTYSQPGKLFFGEARNPGINARVRRLQDLFDRAGIVYETPEDMIRALWWKYMVNVGVNQVSAVARAPYGLFQRSKAARELMESAMREVIAIAKAAGVDLSEDDIQNWFSVLQSLSPDGKTSMLQDVEAGRKTEVEMFAGEVNRLGESYGIPTPVNQTLYRFIKVIEGGTPPKNSSARL
jgi:2-dehydropantoate 2-reductase